MIHSDFNPKVFYLNHCYLSQMKSANRKIVEFIRDKWVIPIDNNSEFARNHFLEEKTVRRIKDDENYNISLNTIVRICEAKNLKLSEFFAMVGV